MRLLSLSLMHEEGSCFIDDCYIYANLIFPACIDNWKSPVMLDAPVSGGVLAAESGTLTFMVFNHFFIQT